MKLKFVRRIGYDDKESDSVGELRLGEEYFCLGIRVNLLILDPPRCKFHVLKCIEYGEPQAFYANALCFEIVSDRFPETWQLVIRNGTTLVYADRALSSDNVLDRFYTHDDPLALEQFLKICKDAMI